jgi:hypothetical protein
VNRVVAARRVTKEGILRYVAVYPHIVAITDIAAADFGLADTDQIIAVVPEDAVGHHKAVYIAAFGYAD